MVVIFRFTIYYEQTKYFYQNNAMNWKNKIKVKDFLIGKKYSFIFGKCKLSSAVFKIPFFVFVFVSRRVNRKCKRYLITKKKLQIYFNSVAVASCLKIHTIVIMFWPYQRSSLNCLQLDNIPKMQISQRVTVTTFTMVIY